MLLFSGESYGKNERAYNDTLRTNEKAKLIFFNGRITHLATHNDDNENVF